MILKSLILFILVSCGNSPFLNEKDVSAEKQSIKYNGIVSFEKINRNVRDSRNNDISLSHYKIDGLWQVGPNLEAENKLVLIVTDSDGNRVDLPLEFEIYLWMPGMGHGSFPISIKKISTGIIELSEVFFTMGGYWDLHIGLKDGESLIDELKWPINL